MKKTIYIILILFLSGLTFTSCGKKPVSNYKCAILHRKSHNLSKVRIFILEVKVDKIYRFKKIHVSNYDYNRFEAGDTIK